MKIFIFLIFSLFLSIISYPTLADFDGLSQESALYFFLFYESKYLENLLKDSVISSDLKRLIKRFFYYSDNKLLPTESFNNPCTYFSYYDCVYLIKLFENYGIQIDSSKKDLQVLLEVLLSRVKSFSYEHFSKNSFCKHFRQFLRDASVSDKFFLQSLIGAYAISKIESRLDLISFSKELKDLYFPINPQLHEFYYKILLKYKYSLLVPRAINYRRLFLDQITSMDCSEAIFREFMNILAYDYSKKKFNFHIFDNLIVSNFFSSLNYTIETINSYELSKQWFLLLNSIDKVEYVNIGREIRPTLDNFYKVISYIFLKNISSIDDLKRLLASIRPDFVDAQILFNEPIQENPCEVEIKFYFLKIKYSIFLDSREESWHSWSKAVYERLMLEDEIPIDLPEIVLEVIKQIN